MNRLRHASDDRVEFFVLTDQRLVLIDQFGDLREQCGRQPVPGRRSHLGLGSATPFGGAWGH
jgi:hypothetical protein